MLLERVQVHDSLNLELGNFVFFLEQQLQDLVSSRCCQRAERRWRSAGLYLPVVGLGGLGEVTAVVDGDGAAVAAEGPEEGEGGPLEQWASGAGRPGETADEANGMAWEERHFGGE